MGEHRMETFYDGDSWPLLTLTLPVMLCVVIGLLSVLVYRRRKRKSLKISSPSSSDYSPKPDYSFGTVSSTQSAFSDSELQDVSSSFETICADHFLTCLEDE